MCSSASQSIGGQFFSDAIFDCYSSGRGRIDHDEPLGVVGDLVHQRDRRKRTTSPEQASEVAEKIDVGMLFEDLGVRLALLLRAGQKLSQGQCAGVVRETALPARSGRSAPIYATGS